MVARESSARGQIKSPSLAQREREHGSGVGAGDDETSAKQLNASVAEVLWSVAFNAGEGSPTAGVHLGPNNRNRFRPEAALEATFDQANDVRFAAYFATRNSNGGVPRRIVTSHHTPVEGRENTEPVWSPSATRFSAPTSHYYHRRRQVSSGLGIFRLSAARKLDPTRNRTPASWMANERHTTTLTHVFNVPPDVPASL